jgi:hypothetical protein
MAQHLVSLLGQGDELTRALLLPGDADLKHLLGFLTSRYAAQGWQAKRYASRILGLAHPMVLGHPEKRCNALGADRHADVIEPEGRGGPQLEVKIGSKLPAHRG